MQRGSEKGFTLIELLVVIAIIGILSTLAVVALNVAREKARDAKRLSDVKTVQTALELYENDHQDYPHEPDDQPSMPDGTPFDITGMSLCAGGFQSTPCAPDETTYVATIPNAPTNDCTSDYPDFHYTYLYNPPSGFYIVFCNGTPSGSLPAGPLIATEGGIIQPADIPSILNTNGPEIIN